MKTRLHRLLLGTMLLLIGPGTLLACILSFAAIATSFKEGPTFRSLATVPLLLIAPALFAWGIHLFRSLRSGYDGPTRRQLLAFHLVDFVYCGVWLNSSVSRDGYSGMIFSPIEQIIGFIILLLPVFVVLFTRPDATRASAASMSLKRAINDWVAWLAARVR